MPLLPKALASAFFALVAVAIVLLLTEDSADPGREIRVTAAAEEVRFSSPFGETCARSLAVGRVTGEDVEIRELSLAGCDPCPRVSAVDMPYEAQGSSTSRERGQLVTPVKLRFVGCNFGIDCVFGADEARLTVRRDKRRTTAIADEVALSRLPGSSPACATKSSWSAEYVVTETFETTGP